MRIQHNIMAMNAYRNYNNNTSALSKNLEKLSSGYKINRAGDDAAGLAISEKMRAQITGLNAAQKNVKDGISLVKTAEGAMQEIQDMLNRMDYLATQSANGTYDDPVDRKNLQKEVDALKSEINRIADSANFNGIKLLDGSLDPDAVKAKADAAVDKANTDAAAADAASFVDVAVTAIHDHEISDGPKKMKFTLDLSSLKAENAGTGAGTVSITAAGNLAITAAVAANSTMSTTFTIGVTQVLIGSVSFNVTVNGSKIIYEMAADPTTAWTTELADATVTAAGTDSNIDVNWGEGLQYHIDQEAVAAVKPDQAQGKFTLTTAMLADGARLTIGDTTYTFALKGGANEGAENAVILDNLTDVASAAARLSKVAMDTGDFIVGANATDGEITLTERVTTDGKSNADYDLAGTSAALSNATWKRTDGTGIVKYNTAVKPTAQTKDPNAGGNGLTLQIGDTSDTFNQLSVVVGDMHVNAMGAGTFNEGTAEEKVITDTIEDIDISTQEGAQNAIDVIKNAINYVSGIRGDLGAVQNRLEHTANNLSVMAENIQDAESTIRDTDVAEEMMSYVKNNILVQSAQAMLAQANQVPQGVLQLLG